MKKIQYNGESKLLSGIATKINWLIDQVGTKIDASEKGVANGVATLDGGGKVPSSQLPSYVDDVIEGYYYNDNFYEDSAHTELITPETSKIYVDLPTNKTYRWGGSEYVEISSGADEKVRQIPYTTSDTNARELLLSKSTDGLEHTEEAYKSDALKFKYGIGFSQFYIGDYDSQDGYYKSHVYCKWIDCYSISATEISDLWGIALGNQQNNGILRIQNTNGHGVNVYAPTDLTEGEDVRLPSSSGQLALKSEIPTALSQLTDDSTHRLVTDTEKSTWNNDVKWSENNVLGAKNLFPYPYQDTTNTTNGITFTDNGDGTVTVSGTASANTRFSFDNYATNDPINFPLPGGQKYIVSRGYTETTNAYMFIRVFYTANLSDSESVLVELKNSDEVLDLTNYPTIYGFRSQIVVANGTAITTPITFKPMIRLESITDDTYVPFGMTNIALTNNKFEKTAKTQPSGQDLNDYKETGIYYFNTSGATNVPIGSNGMLLVFKANWDSVGIFVKQIWMRHGTQNGNDYQTYIRTYRSDNGGSWSDWHRLITQEGGTITGVTTFNRSDGTTSAVGDSYITLGNSTASGTANNSRGRIQIYGADNHYTNLRAQDSVAEHVATYLPAVRGTLAIENTYMTAKNLLPLKTWSKNGLVSGNATFTVNGDGTITVNRTTTTGTGTFYITDQQENGGLYLPNGTYILSGCPQGGSTSTSSGYQLGVRCYKNGATVSLGNDGGDGLEFTVDGDDFSNDGAWIRTMIVFRGGASADNLVFKPMIMPKTFTDKSFTPPAKTNADLTAQAQGILDMIATTEPSNSASKAYAVGDYMIWKGKFYKVTTAISSGGTISTSKLTETTLGAELKSALT